MKAALSPFKATPSLIAPPVQGDPALGHPALEGHGKGGYPPVGAGSALSHRSPFLPAPSLVFLPTVPDVELEHT